MLSAEKPEAMASLGPVNHASEEAVAEPQVRYAAHSDGIDEFVRAYHPFVDEATVLLPADDQLTVGEKRRFTIVLAGGEVVLRGRCRAIEFGAKRGCGAIRAAV